jgi:hypothetical protein
MTRRSTIYMILLILTYMALSPSTYLYFPRILSFHLLSIYNQASAGTRGERHNIFIVYQFYAAIIFTSQMWKRLDVIYISWSLHLTVLLKIVGWHARGRWSVWGAPLVAMSVLTPVASRMLATASYAHIFDLSLLYVEMHV